MAKSNFRDGNHRTKKKNAKGGKVSRYEHFDGSALLKQLQSENKKKK